MKPLHAAITRLRRCPCCQSRYSKINHGGNSGKTAARANVKREIRKTLRGVTP